MLHQQKTNLTSMIVYLALKVPSLQRTFVTGRRHCPANWQSDRTAAILKGEHINTKTSSASFPEDGRSLLVAPMARSSQSPLDGHHTAATPIFFPEDWDLSLANPLLLSHAQFWDHPVSVFDEGIDSYTFIMQNYGPHVDATQFQLAQFHPHLYLPHIDWGFSQGPPLLHTNQATTPVSIIVYL